MIPNIEGNVFRCDAVPDRVYAVCLCNDTGMLLVPVLMQAQCRSPAVLEKKSLEVAIDFLNSP